MPLDNAFWAELDRLRTVLTTEQWQVVRLTAMGHSIVEMAPKMYRHQSSARQLKIRALKRIFKETWIEPRDGSLGSWYARHVACCDR